MNGEEFLNKLYKDLNLSDEVQHTSKGTKNKDEAVKRYMDRLESAHLKAISSGRQSDIERLKYLYHKKYVVKENNIPNYRDKERIIKAQEESLDKWLDYLLDENAKYPMWAKYWAFQGMLKIGTYDEANDVYQRRSKKTLAPFIEANPEIIAKCIGIVTDYVGKKELNDKELEHLVASGNFQKLYTILLNKNKEQIHHNSNIEDGRWITYHYETEEEANEKERRGIEPEYLKLYNSLQGYNTGWCTAGDKETAKDQVCGISWYDGGNFYVYYTKDKNGEYKVPRIAIRMDEDDIGEIRGIAEGQNVEDGLEIIIEKKIKEIPGVSENKIKETLKAISDMKRLTLLNRKSIRKEEFTEEDIKFIYELDEMIEGFGWDEDPRIEQILSTRDKKEDYNRNSEIALKAVKKNGLTLGYVDKDIEGYREIVLAAVKQDGRALQYVDKTIEGYREIAIEAVKNYGLQLAYIDKNTEGYREIVLAAVKKERRALRYVDKDIEGYREIALEAVKQDGRALQYVDKDIEGYREIALEAVKQDGRALKFVDKDIEGYREIVLEAVKQNGHALQYVDKDIEGYREIAVKAVKQTGYAIKHVDKNIEGYYKLLHIASETEMKRIERENQESKSR